MRNSRPVYIVVNALVDTRSKKRTGISRVEYELAKHLLGQGAKPIAWHRNRFVEIDFAGDVEGPTQRRFPLWLRRSVAFEDGGTVVLVSVWWSEWPFEVIRHLKESHNLRFVSMIHDLIPIRRPEFLPDDGSAGRFRNHVNRAIALSDAIIVSSSYVADDVRAYAQECGIRIAPVEVCPLCSDLRQSAMPVCSSRLGSTGIAPGRFVVFVSSINSRKNHRWLYFLWRRVVDELGDSVPPLVFAGQLERMEVSTLELISADVAMWNRKLFFIESPSDSELSWLYANCAFSMFPSLCEGWGLPITESLSFGKYCLAADNTSLVEVGQGLTFNADPLDGLAWIREIRKLLQEPDYLRYRNDRAASAFRARSWPEFGEQVADLINSLGDGVAGSPLSSGA